MVHDDEMFVIFFFFIFKHKINSLFWLMVSFNFEILELVAIEYYYILRMNGTAKKKCPISFSSPISEHKYLIWNWHFRAHIRVEWKLWGYAVKDCSVYVTYHNDNTRMRFWHFVWRSIASILTQKLRKFIHMQFDNVPALIDWECVCAIVQKILCM